jgi:CheY-like chemotaxis protein
VPLGALLWCGRGRAVAPRLMPKVALVVDDSMLMRYTVCRFLEERGFAVESASNGVEALEVLARVQPELVVTDMQMPKMSGGELITALKANPGTAKIPIIIVASRASGFDESENRANFAIYKDVDVEAQLKKALALLQGMPKAQGQASTS